MDSINKVLCGQIDDCTLEVVRGEDTIVVSYQEPYVVIINTEVVNLSDECPLVTYVGTDGFRRFRTVVHDIVMSFACESFFSRDINKHMKNGYPVDDDTAVKVQEIAKYAYKTWLDYRSKQSDYGKVESYEGEDSFF